jgi:hypothetical protein
MHGAALRDMSGVRTKPEPLLRNRQLEVHTRIAIRLLRSRQIEIRHRNLAMMRARHIQRRARQRVVLNLLHRTPILEHQRHRIRVIQSR